jgi:hypothetical protein
MQKVNMHTGENHAVDNWKFLKHQQRNAVSVVVKASQLSTPVEVCCDLKNSSLQKQIDAQLLSSVCRAVSIKHTNLTSILFPLCQVLVTGSLGSLTSLCKSTFLPYLILPQNNPAYDFHLDFMKMNCIALKTDGGTFVLFVIVGNFCMFAFAGDRQLFIAFESVHARQTGLPICLPMGKSDMCGYYVPDTMICNEAVNMLTTGITEMQGVHHPTGAFIISDGSERFVIYLNSLTELEIAASTLIADVQPCDKAGCKTCTFVSDINTEPALKKFMKANAAKEGVVLSL